MFNVFGLTVSTKDLVFAFTVADVSNAPGLVHPPASQAAEY